MISDPWFVGVVGGIVSAILATPIIAYLTINYRRYKRRKRGALWKRFSNDETCIAIVADHRKAVPEGWEPGGLIATADARAYAFLAAELHQLKIDLDLRLADDGRLPQGDLLLIGGPDVNDATYLYMHEVQESLTWSKPLPAAADHELPWGTPERHPVSILDKKRGVYINARFLPDPRDGLLEDYGLITVTPNPFAPTGWVVCICGIYGPGTDAAARHLFHPQFVCEPLVKGRSPFQALIKATILHRVVQSTHLEEIRPLTLVTRGDQVAPNRTAQPSEG